MFDPARIKSFDPMSRVPLGAYRPLTVAPATAASRRALHGADLLPNQNLGGLVSQPVNLITTLSALPALENSRSFTGVHAADPISVIQVRVAGATGPDALSRKRINAVAQQIAQRTGLDVDIVDGSSPSPVTVDLPASKYGPPSLTLSENWVKKGVALLILNAVDKTSVALFTLILVVCVLFVGNAATAAVRGRRRELGVLAAVGWRRSRLFATVLGELAGTGLAAGLLAAAIAVSASAGLGLDASPGRALLAVPVAVAVAVVGGLLPAWRAARADPVSSVRPPVLAVRRAHHPRGTTSLALLNVTRTADDVTITIEAGAFAALTGASGSGKSTMLHMIGAIERPDSGTIISDGIAHRHRPRPDQHPCPAARRRAHRQPRLSHCRRHPRPAHPPARRTPHDNPARLPRPAGRRQSRTGDPAPRRRSQRRHPAHRRPPSQRHHPPHQPARLTRQPTRPR